MIQSKAEFAEYRGVSLLNVGQWAAGGWPYVTQGGMSLDRFHLEADVSIVAEGTPTGSSVSKIIRSLFRF
jgi:phage terminase Nu1 subunit (DNA packaging protein)